MAFLAGRKLIAVAIIFCSLGFGSQSIKQVKQRALNSCGKLWFIFQTKNYVHFLKYTFQLVSLRILTCKLRVIFLSFLLPPCQSVGAGARWCSRLGSAAARRWPASAIFLGWRTSLSKVSTRQNLLRKLSCTAKAGILNLSYYSN